MRTIEGLQISTEEGLHGVLVEGELVRDGLEHRS